MNHFARQVITLAVAAGTIIAATACGTSSAPHQPVSNSPSAATTPVAEPRSACDALGGTVDAGRICHTHTAGPGYQVSFTFQADYPDQQALTDYMTKRREDFKRYAAERPPRDHPYELDATAKAYRSGTPTSGTESLVFSVYSESGGAHPVTGYQGFDYDLGKRAPITLDTLFKPGTDPVAVLDPIVAREFGKFSDDYGPAGDNTLGAKVYQNFAITDDAVIFFIGQGQWLPQVAGPQQVSVPRAELASLLA